MLHNDAAQWRPGEKPTSAPEASQKLPRTQGRANFKIPTLKRARSRPGDTNAAGLADGNMETTHIIHIHDRHNSPPRLDLTTHDMTSTLYQPHDPTKTIRQKPKLLTRLVRYHPFGEGHEQARPAPGLDQGTEPGQLPRHTTEDLQQNPQGQANFKIPTLKRASSRPGDTNAASLTDGNMETSHNIYIHGGGLIGSYDPYY